MGSKKSASAPPRGGAQEPGRQLSAFHQDYANRLPEQTQRHVYSSAARARRHGGGIIKNFHWEGESQRELNTATTISLHTLQLIIQITASTYSGATPFFLYSITIPYGTYTQLNRTSQAEGLLEPTRLLPLYTLIHPARSNTLAAQVLGLGVP